MREALLALEWAVHKNQPVVFHEEKAKDSCKGKDGCKGKDSCKAHDCKGKNDCKGKGGCKSTTDDKKDDTKKG